MSVKETDGLLVEKPPFCFVAFYNSAGSNLVPARARRR